jgi:hypothetical protein
MADVTAAENLTTRAVTPHGFVMWELKVDEQFGHVPRGTVHATRVDLLAGAHAAANLAHRGQQAVTGSLRSGEAVDPDREKLLRLSELADGHWGEAVRQLEDARRLTANSDPGDDAADDARWNAHRAVTTAANASRRLWRKIAPLRIPSTRP